MILEAFEDYCAKHNITSEQYKEDIFPHFAAGYTVGQKLVRKAIQDNAVRRNLFNVTRRGNPA